MAGNPRVGLDVVAQSILGCLATITTAGAAQLKAGKRGVVSCDRSPLKRGLPCVGVLAMPAAPARTLMPTHTSWAQRTAGRGHPDQPPAAQRHPCSNQHTHTRRGGVSLQGRVLRGRHVASCIPQARILAGTHSSSRFMMLRLFMSAAESRGSSRRVSAGWRQSRDERLRRCLQHPQPMGLCCSSLRGEEETHQAPRRWQRQQRAQEDAAGGRQPVGRPAAALPRHERRKRVPSEV